MLRHLPRRWDRPRVIEFAVTGGFCTVFLRRFAHYCENVIEQRPGVVLHDPILTKLPVIDLTWPIFAVLYMALISALGLLALRPTRLCAGLQTYALMIAFRWVGMFLVPIDPPPGMITLEDPVIIWFGPSITLTRDLFFSGHTGTMCLLIFTATTKLTRVAYCVGLVLVAAFILFQRVHYTFDVFAAPAFALLAWRIVLRTRGWLKLPDALLDIDS
jgi:hypothetical protein